MQQAAQTLPVVEEQAFQLSQAAIRLDQTRVQRTESPDDFSAALDQNLDVWMAIRTVAERSVPGFPNDVRHNLVKLSHFVADTTFAGPDGLGDSTVDTLININLQISEGLLEARVGA